MQPIEPENLKEIYRYGWKMFYAQSDLQYKFKDLKFSRHLVDLGQRSKYPNARLRFRTMTAIGKNIWMQIQISRLGLRVIAQWLLKKRSD